MSLRRLAGFVCALLLCWGVAAPAAAQTRSLRSVDDTIPAPLRPWVSWAMYDQPDLACPQVDGTDTKRVCVWPGSLTVEANAKGASFAMQVWLARDDDVVLPGDDTLWPQDVHADGGAAVIGQTDNHPRVHLAAGAHRLTGTFQWTSVPQVLPTPASTGRIGLTVGGTRVEHPRLDADGRLWLQGGAGLDARDEADSIHASIYRRVEDGSPLKVTTQLELNVSGKAREIDLGHVLLAHSRPTSVESPLPVKITPDGGVSVYGRPGTHRVTIAALLTQKTDTITAPAPGPDFYDPQEVWVWIPDETLRSVELSGLQAVDPARTSLPKAWHGHTTFLAKPNASLKLAVSRRGVTPSPNTIGLRRQMWLDLDGDGYTIRDHLTGTLDRGWRLDYAGPAELGHVLDQANKQDVLITKNPTTKHSGVELRHANLDVTADLRREAASATLPAVGWDHDVQNLSAVLNLPPGWTLLATSGVDQVDGTWVDSWTLWDFFFVLMVALSIGKLLGWRWTPLAIVALVLSHGHADAPMWVWLHLVAALALLRALPDGWWRKGVYLYRLVALLVLFGLLAPFAYDQIRAGLHPQVSPDAFRTRTAHNTSLPTPVAYERAMAPAPMKDEVAANAAVRQQAKAWKKKQDKAVGMLTRPSSLSYASSDLDLQQVDPKAVVQTGPGLPNWSWNSWQLRWSGPVHKEHQMHLWLVSPLVNRLLAFLRVALLIILSLLVLDRRHMRWNKDDDDDTPARGGTFWSHLTQAGVAMLAAGFVLGASSHAFAQTAPEATPPSPSPQVLQTLKQRLVAAHKCDGVCVVVSRADITANGSTLRMRAEVHAQKDAGWYLPGPAADLQIESVRLDGAATDQLRREASGLTAVHVPAGRHIVDFEGRLANRNVVTVQFDATTRPKLVSFSSDDWSVDGISPTGVPDNSLQLTRTESAASPGADGPQQAAELPPWYQVHRLVGLGLPWKVRTTVTRQDATRPQLVKLPLLAGEKVVTDGLRVEDNQVLVDFPRGQSTVTYTSHLPITKHLVLTAAHDQPWSETWTVECSRIWRCAFSKLPPTKLVGEDQVFRPTWKPWPGETLSIDVRRPAGAEGQSSTVESVDYDVTPGQRLLEATLTLQINASQGGWQNLTLPAGAELQKVTIDNAERSLRLDKRKLAVPIRPGEHTYVVTWQQPWQRSWVERVPQVDLGGPAANVAVRVHRGYDRWLLRVTGPAWGPAILFWGHLVILLIIAVLLSQLRGLPLKLHEWMLLVIGMSQLPFLALIPVAAWFVVVELRRNNPPKDWWRFDLAQLGVIALTIAAAITLFAAVHTNLLVHIDMQVQGAQSSNHLLRWYVDRSGAKLPTPAIVSAPVLVWRVLMLLWAFWLVSRLLKWVPWGWRAFATGGLWRRRNHADAKVDAPPQTNGTVDPIDEADGDVSTESAPKSDDSQADDSQADDSQADDSQADDEE